MPFSPHPLQPQGLLLLLLPHAAEICPMSPLLPSPDMLYIPLLFSPASFPWKARGAVIRAEAPGVSLSTAISQETVGQIDLAGNKCQGN